MNRFCKDLSIDYQHPRKSPSLPYPLEKILYDIAIEDLESSTHTDLHRCISCQRAFSLLEVCVVIAVIGLLSAIAIPSYMGWKPGYEFRSAVSKIQRELNRSKMRAVEIRRQCRVQVCGTDYQVIDGDKVMASDWNVPGTKAPPNCPMADEERSAFLKAGRRVYLGSLAVYNQVTMVAGTVDPTFSPRGTAFPSSFMVQHDNGNSAMFAVNIVGRVRIAWQ